MDAIRRADAPTLVDGDDLLDAAVRDVLGPDSTDRDGAAVAAGYRAAVAEVLPSGVGLRGLAFAGSAVTPENAVAAIRAAVSAGGAVAVVAHLASDALAARLLRSAVRRAEADLTQLRAAQRANAQRRVAEGVPKARIARDLGVQRVTVDAWLRTSATAESAPPTPAPAPTRLPPAVEPADPIGPPNPPITTPRPRRTGRGRASTTARARAVAVRPGHRAAATLARAPRGVAGARPGSRRPDDPDRPPHPPGQTRRPHPGLATTRRTAPPHHRLRAAPQNPTRSRRRDPAHPRTAPQDRHPTGTTRQGPPPHRQK